MTPPGTFSVEKKNVSGKHFSLKCLLTDKNIDVFDFEASGLNTAGEFYS